MFCPASQRSCGWLAYMPQTLNQEKWCQSIKQLYETMCKGKVEEEFQIGLHELDVKNLLKDHKLITEVYIKKQTFKTWGDHTANFTTVIPDG